MSKIIPISLAVEDELSEAVLKVILNQSKRLYSIGTCYKKHGFGYLKSKIKSFNAAAKFVPFAVLTDLDRTECPPLLVKEWLDFPKHGNLIFRIAVRQVESWLMAHRKKFAEFMGVNENLIPSKPDELENSKRKVIELASKSRIKEIREAIVPKRGSSANIGPDYNGKLIYFVYSKWNPADASKNSQSLKKAMDCINGFQPTFAY